MLSRLVLGYLLALPAMVALALQCTGTGRAYTVVVRMSAVANGPIQLFYDTGTGLSQKQSVLTPLQPSTAPREYEFPLPSGTYRSLRIDPGTSGGLYVVESVGVRTYGGWRTYALIPLTDINPVHQLEVIERSPERLVLESPPASNDPQLLYAPASPMLLEAHASSSRWLLWRLAALWVCGVLIVYVAERIVRPVGSSMRAVGQEAMALAQKYPAAGLVAVALVSTLVSTYPVVFFGRSFASANYGTPLLYGQPPYGPGAIDFDIEDVRGSDVGATMWQGIPHSRIQRQAILEGEFPLWNRYNAAGRPLWGQGLTFLLDPLHWLALIPSEPSIGWDLKFVAHRWVFAAGVGLAAFVATGAWLPAAVVAAGAPFTGVHAYRFTHPAIFSLTYAPWVLWSWFLLSKASHFRTKAWACIFLALTSALVLFASTPKEGAVGLVALQATGAMVVLLTRDPFRERLSRLLMAAFAGVALLLLTMPQWFIFLQTLKASATDYDNPSITFAESRHLVGLFLGTLVPGTPPPGLHLVALVSVIAAVSFPRKLLRQPPVLACGIGALVLIALAFGLVPAALLLKVPFLGNIGHFYDASLTAAVTLLLVFSAAGADVLLSASRRRAWTVTFLTALTCWLLIGRVGTMAAVDSFESWPLFLIAPLAIALPGCWLTARRDFRAFAAAGAASAALLLPGGMQLDSGSSALDHMLVQPRPRPALDENSPAVDAVHRLTVEPTRSAGVDLVLWPGSQALYEVEGLGGADPLEVPAYRELVDAAGISRDWYWLTLVTAPKLDRLTPLLDMLNVGFLFARSDSLPPHFEPIPMDGGDLVRAEQRATAWPRAFFADGVTTFSSTSELLRSVAEQRSPFAAVQALDSPAIAATRQLAAPSSPAIPADDYALTVNTTTFHVRAPRSGIAVLGETYLSNDFRATLNGRPVDYFRVNQVFKAVVIPGPGDWQIRFEYRPAHWTEVWLAALVGALLLAGLAVVTERHHRRDRLSTAQSGARAHAPADYVG